MILQFLSLTDKFFLIQIGLARYLIELQMWISLRFNLLIVVQPACSIRVDNRKYNKDKFSF